MQDQKQKIQASQEEPVNEAKSYELIIGIVVVVALLIIGGYLGFKNYFTTTQETSKNSTEQTENTQAEKQSLEAADQPINSIDDLDLATEKLDKTDLDLVEEDLNKNDSDASEFIQ